MRPELRICVKIFLYIVKCVVKSLVYRQHSFVYMSRSKGNANTAVQFVRQESRQQTFNSAVQFVTSVKSLVNRFVYASRSTMQCQQSNSSRRQEYRQKKLRVCVNFQITASTRASGVNQSSIVFTTVVRAGNVVRMARASSWPDKSRQQRVVEVRRA